MDLSSFPISPNKSQRPSKLRAEEVANRLYMDAEARRAREEKLRKERGEMPSRQGRLSRGSKLTQTDRSKATQGSNRTDAIKKNKSSAPGAQPHYPPPGGQQDYNRVEPGDEQMYPPQQFAGGHPDADYSVPQAPSSGHLSQQQQQEHNDRMLAYLDRTLKKQESILKLQESLSQSNGGAVGSQQ